MVSHMQVHPWHREENASKEGKGRQEGCSKQSAHTFSLTEPLPEKRKGLLSSWWALL